MKPRTFAVMLGLAMFIAGVILGIVGGSATVKSENIFDSSIVSPEEISCKSVFDGGDVNDVPLGTPRVEAQEKCDEVTGSRSTWVWVLMGLGAVIALGGGLIRPTRTVAPPAAPATGPAPDGHTADGQPYWLNRPTK